MEETQMTITKAILLMLLARPDVVELIHRLHQHAVMEKQVEWYGKVDCEMYEPESRYYCVVSKPIMGEEGRATIRIGPDTFLIFHTHPGLDDNTRDARPSQNDINAAKQSGVSDIVISAQRVYIVWGKTGKVEELQIKP
jgi:hypothetical protein